MYRCNGCDEVFDDDEICGCQRPDLVVVTLTRPPVPGRSWLLPALGLIMLSLLVLVVFRAEERGDNRPKPGEDGSVDLTPKTEGRLIDERPVVLTPEAEGQLINVRRVLQKNLDAEETAFECLRRVVGRIRSLEGRITSDVQRGGVLANQDFRLRWSYLVSPERWPNRETPTDVDATLEGDVVNHRPLTRGRIKTLVETVKAARVRLQTTANRERLVTEFIRSLPSPGLPLLLVSTDKQREELLKRRTYPDVIEQALTVPAGETVGLMRSDTNDGYDVSKHQVDGVDALLLTCLSRGLVRSAYALKGLNVDKLLGALNAAEKSLLALLVEKTPESQELEAKRNEWRKRYPPPTPLPLSHDKLYSLYRFWTFRDGTQLHGTLLSTEGGWVYFEDNEDRSKARYSFYDLSAFDQGLLAPYFKEEPKRD